MRLLPAAHEFTTPLTIIQTSLYILGKTTDIDSLQKHRYQIRKVADDIYKLVETLISILRLDALSQFNLMVVNLNDMIYRVTSVLQEKIEKNSLTC